MIDYHIHTKLCGHATGEMEQYIETAKKIGLSEMGFADHYPLKYQPKYSVPIEKLNMKQEEIIYYLSKIEYLKKRESSIKIKKGFEVDYYEKDNSFFKNNNGLYDELDYVITSVHFFDEISMDQKEFDAARKKIGIENVWRKYFEEMKKAIQNYRNYFDIIGHFDLPKKFGDTIPESLLPLVDEILNLIKVNELVVEINTSGWDKPVKELYPSIDILTKANNFGIEFTAGSDAHSPEDVGRKFDKLKNILQQLNIKKLIIFSKHQKEYFRI